MNGYRIRTLEEEDAYFLYNASLTDKSLSIKSLMNPLYSTLITPTTTNPVHVLYHAIIEDPVKEEIQSQIDGLYVFSQTEGNRFKNTICHPDRVSN